MWEWKDVLGEDMAFHQLSAGRALWILGEYMGRAIWDGVAV